jgi:mannose-6-phosphate isomerase-like protein (cupin superfamily)
MPFDEARRWRNGSKQADFYARSIRPRLGDRERERARIKVVKPEDMPWEDSPHGRLKHVVHGKMNVRVNSVDAYFQELAPGGRSGKHRHMADEVLYVLEGKGYDLHWDVDVRLGTTYEWVVGSEPSRWEWEEGDLVWIPTNTVHQHFNADPERPARFLSAQNRMFKHMGYDDVEQLEAAPEWREGRT